MTKQIKYAQKRHMFFFYVNVWAMSFTFFFGSLKDFMCFAGTLENPR